MPYEITGTCANRFHADEMWGNSLKPFFHEAGLSITSTHEVGLTGASDEAQLDFANRNRRCLITKDRDFFALKARTSAGIIWCQSYETPRAVRDFVVSPSFRDVARIPNPDRFQPPPKRTHRRQRRTTTPQPEYPRPHPRETAPSCTPIDREYVVGIPLPTHPLLKVFAAPAVVGLVSAVSLFPFLGIGAALFEFLRWLAPERF